MPVYREPRSPNWIIEFTHQGQRYRKSSGTSNKRKALELERHWRSQVYEKHVFGISPSITLEQALDRYWSTIIVPKGKKRSAQVTLYILERIRKHFGPETALETITTAQATGWADSLIAEGTPGTIPEKEN